MNLAATPDAMLASVNQFLQQIEADLVRGRSTLVIVPNDVPPDFVLNHLRDRLSNRGFYVESVYLSMPEMGADPVDALARTFAVKWPTTAVADSADKLFRHAQSLPEVILCYDLESLPAPQVRNWLEFQRAWADVSHTSAGQQAQGTAVCYVASAAALRDQALEPKLLLDEHWWWNLPSHMEVRLHCRLRASGSERSALELWREALLPELAGSDIDLVQTLWDVVSATPGELTCQLCAAGEARGWTRQQLIAWGATDPSLAALRPTQPGLAKPQPAWRQLWANGVLYCTDEQGIELHVIALAVLGRVDEVQHRLWRAQTGLIFPIIDRLRLLLCLRFTQRCGPSWPLQWLYPPDDEQAQALRASPMSCQWGHLKRLIDDKDALPAEKQFKPLITTAHRLRNELAHGRPVTFSQFETLWHETGRLHF